MADLEEKGFLTQPHISAGRVPTDRAYRLFVDYSPPYETLSDEDLNAVEQCIVSKVTNFQQLLIDATELLSSLTNYAGLVLMPTLATWILKHVDFVSLGEKRILVVIVSEAGLVTNNVLELDESLTQEELTKLANYMNESFEGLSLSKIRERLKLLLNEDKTRYDQLLHNATKLGERAFDLVDVNNVYVGGAVKLLVQPEFKGTDRLDLMLQAITDKNVLVDILNRCLEKRDPVIYIGKEKPQLEETSLIAVKYYYQNQVMGALGVIGPTRMPYPKVISLVNFTARTLSKILSRDAAINCGRS